VQRILISTFRNAWITILIAFTPEILLAGSELNFYFQNMRQSFPAGTEFLWEQKGEPGFSVYQKNKDLFTTNTPQTLSNQDPSLWIKIPLQALKKQRSLFLLIPNSHINRIQCYYLNAQGEMLDSTLIMGDHIAFANRPVHFPEYIFPISEDTIQQYMLLYLDKRNEPFFTSIQILNHEELDSRKTNYFLLSGILLGILVAAFIINIYIVLNAKNVLNYLYSLFLGLCIIYTLSDFGYIHWIINYESNWIIDIVRPLSLSIAFPIYLFFFINTVSFEQHYPKWSARIKQYGWIWLGYVLIASAISPFLYDNSYKYYSLALSLGFQQITLIIVIVSAILSLRKGDRYAIPFLIASFLFILTHFHYMAHRFGYTEDTVVQQHFVPIILGMDCLIIGGIVALRFIDFIHKNKSLEFALLNKDIEINERIASIQLRELSRISQLLHNHIGMELIGLKNNLEQNKNEIPNELHDRLYTRTKGLIEDVRNTAHFLSPQVLRKFGLAHCIQLFVKEICKTKQIKNYVEITPACNQTTTNIQLVVMLIIQECLNNTTKHAQATEIQVQCFVENKHLYITYQDNGIGMKSNEEMKDGIGILQIKEMINVCRGICNIESNPGEGFQLNAEIPLDI
jgi:signal transduction histidine kinase